VNVLTCGDRTLRNNNLSGTLDVGTSYSRKLQLVDLQNNSITGKVDSAGGYNKNLMYAILVIMVISFAVSMNWPFDFLSHY